MVHTHTHTHTHTDVVFLFPLTCVALPLAGDSASFCDQAYTDAGAVVVQHSDMVFQNADIITKIRPPSDDEVPKLASKTLVSMIQPAINRDLYETLTAQHTNVFALDCVPRMLSRGQSYDTLSSQANIAGYRAVIEAAEVYPRFFAGQMTAAGKIPPAKVLVLGAGVAGLAAIQTAKAMGAIVRAFDVRPVCKEQVESMGGVFLEVEMEEDGSGAGGYAKEMSDDYKHAQAQLMLDQAKDVDIIITTALIPGRAAPVLVNEEMLSLMKQGSVCVDLAAANGGNVAQTQADKVITTDNGVTIVGYTDLPSRLANTASNLVSTGQRDARSVMFSVCYHFSFLTFLSLFFLSILLYVCMYVSHHSPCSLPIMLPSSC
jgi:NAD(P) transhydrogenase